MKTSMIEQSQNQPWMTDLKKLQEATGGVFQKNVSPILMSVSKSYTGKKSCRHSNN